MTIGFLTNNEKKQTTEQYETKSGEHVMIESKTGAGKTRLALSIHDQKAAQEEGILWFDPKNKLHRELKKHSKDPTDIFLLGAPAEGENDIRINLFQKIVDSESKALRFSYALIAGEKATDSHKFWSEAAAEMFFHSMNFIYELQQLISMTKNISDREILFCKEFSIKDTDSSKKSTFKIDATPVTFESFYKRISDYDQFKIMCNNSNAIATVVVGKAKSYLSSRRFSKEDATKLDKHLSRVKRFAFEISKYSLNDSRAEASGDNGVYMSMIKSIPSELYSDRGLNITEDTHNMIELLEEGKHIVVSKDSKIISSALFNYVTDHLSLRSSKHDARPVSIFMEEASRILTRSTDLEGTLAYARESKLSVVFVVQSFAQIIEIYGQNISSSILENLTRINLLPRKKTDLDTFQYEVNNNIYTFNPRFCSDKEIYKAELEYQKMTKEYLSIDKEENEVVIFNHRLFEQREAAILVNIDSMTVREVPYSIYDTNGYFFEQYKSIEYMIDIEDELSEEYDLDPERYTKLANSLFND